MANALNKTIQLYKEAFSGHPKEVWSLVFLTFINRMGTMVIPFLTVYLTTVMGFSLESAGLLMSAYGFGSLGGTYIGGRLSDRIGANQVIIASLGASGFLLVSLQFAHSFNSLAILIFITSLFGEAYRPAMSAAVGYYVPKNKTGRSMAFIRLAINLGMAAGPAIGGFVAATVGYQGLFWLDGLTCVSAAVYFLIVSRKWKKKVEEGQKDNGHQGGDLSIPYYRNRNYLLFLLATFLAGFCLLQWFHTVPVFIKSEWGFDERYIGILLGLNGILIALFEMPIVDNLEKAGKIKLSVIFGLGLLGISFLPFLFPKALILCFIGIILFSIGEIFFLPFNNSIPLTMSPADRRGEYMAGYWMMWSLTAITGPFIGLSFASRFGFSAFWILISCLLGVALLMNWMLGDRITG